MTRHRNTAIHRALNRLENRVCPCGAPADHLFACACDLEHGICDWHASRVTGMLLDCARFADWPKPMPLIEGDEALLATYESREYKGWGWGGYAVIGGRPLFIKPIGGGLYAGTRDEHTHWSGAPYIGHDALSVLRWFANPNAERDELAAWHRAKAPR